MIARLLTALEERTGLRDAVRGLAARRIGRGALLSHGLGLTLLALLALEATTGVVLSLHYAPSAADAWSSIAWLDREVPLGLFVRGVHHWGTSALVVVVFLHLAWTIARGAYRAPRELTFWLGLVLVQLVVGLAITGAALPWDQRAYWGSRVETSILGHVPLVGETARALLLGGNEPGNLTLTRFHGLHTLVLPGGLAALLLAHAALSRRHGLKPKDGAGELPLFPDVLVRSLGLALAAVGAVLALAALRPPELLAPADPTSGYLARPAWYFLPLNQLLTFFPGELELVGSVLLPGAAFGFLFVLPLLDRDGRGPRRLLALGGSTGVAGVATALLALGVWHDRTDPTVARAAAEAKAEAALALALAKDGVPPGGSLAMVRADPRTQGKRHFRQRCQGCHPVGGAGSKEPKGPDLAGYLSAPWLRALLEDPDDRRFFGLTKIEGMEGYRDRDPAELARIVQLLVALRAHPDVEPEALPEALQPGVEAYEALSCDGCHELAPGVAGAAPNLAGYGSDGWLLAFLEEPGHELFYGEDNDMPAFRKKLSRDELLSVIAYLRTLEPLPVAPPAPGRVAQTDE